MKTQKMSLDSVRLDDRNARTHDDKNLETIANSLDRFGQQKPIVIDGDGVVIAGNGTVEAARSLGWDSIEVVKTKLTGDDARAFAIADNRTSDLSDWHYNTLIDELGNLEVDMQEAIGFSEEDIAELIQSPLILDEEVVEDVAPCPPSDAVTKPGDLVLLGSHRVYCGDSTNADDVQALFDGAKCDVCFTSPPYNLGKSASLSGNKQISKNGNAYSGHDDDMQSDDWVVMVDAMMDIALSHCDVAVFNVQSLAGNKRHLWKWIASKSESLCDVFIWDKGHAAPAMAAGVASSAFELLVIVGDEGASRSVPHSNWRGTLSNVYAAPPQKDNEYSKQHGATFPVHLPAFVIGKVCDASRSVYDCCCGTGTTLIAAEQLGKSCYGMEIDPAYCDVIVERWEKLTGETAERIREGD